MLQLETIIQWMLESLLMAMGVAAGILLTLFIGW